MVHLTCPAGEIPEFIVCDLKNLELDGHMTYADLALPAGAELADEPGDNVVICPTPKTDSSAEGDEEGATPEVIGKKPEDEA